MVLLSNCRATCDRKTGGQKMDVIKLKCKIIEKNMNVEQLADAIGINRSSLYRKLNNAEKITIGEALKMKEVLTMDDSEAFEIFLM